MPKNIRDEDLCGISMHEILVSIKSSCERRHMKLVKQGMSGPDADKRVLAELRGTLLMHMGRFVFRHEMSSECKLDDCDEDGDPT